MELRVAKERMLVRTAQLYRKPYKIIVAPAAEGPFVSLFRAPFGPGNSPIRVFARTPKQTSTATPEGSGH
jgi:hypothetical protein